jgi:hypothetical protein
VAYAAGWLTETGIIAAQAVAGAAASVVKAL